jgi:hypothetical protein
MQKKQKNRKTDKRAYLDPALCNQFSSSDTSEPGLVSIHKRRKVEDDVTPSLTPLQLTPEKQNISSPVKAETPKNIR